MSFRPPYRYITASNLATVLRAQAKAASSAASSVAIVDVRDDDYEGGNIVGCRNVPSTVFDERVSELVRALSEYPTVIFHCSLSQQRGPKSARIYSEARRDALQSATIQPVTTPSSITQLLPDLAKEIQDDKNGGQDILVLRDGFANFGRIYKDDPQLVEKYDVEAWQWR